jgi:hypothetical protein
MSAAMFAAIKELKARVSALEERVEAQGAPADPKLTAEQQASLDSRRKNLTLSLKKSA